MFFKIFSDFFKIGSFSIGGGLAMIPLIERDIVHKNQWITETEFDEMVIITQSVPGLFAVNIAILVGNKLKGIKGAIVAALACTLPSFLIILSIALFFSDFLEIEWVKNAFTAIRPLVVGLLLVPIYNAARKAKPTVGFWGIIILTLIAVVILHISPIWLLLVLGLFSIIQTYYIIKKKGGNK